MSGTINYGIDLGTTNSAIAHFAEGRVEVFKNPLGLKNTLPSVVAFRKQRILVGDKAKEYFEKDPQNVFGLFKRKMGTDTRWMIQSTAEMTTPVDLSAQVLMELKNFVYSGEKPEAVVVTIPASFDTLQSNATMEAGKRAGFGHVTLLQEPIAASLAYVNQVEKEAGEAGQWLVYDLGGGTFDVALVRVAEGEMRVVDHEGDNFLGGSDFDALIIEKLIIPHLYETGTFENLEKEFKSATGKYNKLWYYLLHKAEEAKVQLSSHSTADIEFEIEDDEAESHDIFLTITREQFEGLIQPQVDYSISMVESILSRNDVTTDEIRFILMVGGSTYIPMVRERVGKVLGVAVNCSIDPTTAVAVGAAYYAGTRTIPVSRAKTPEGKSGGAKTNTEITFRFAYQKASQEKSEYFSAKFEGKITDLFYRIIRNDGGYDSGLKALQERIEEDLPLVENVFNQFKFILQDKQGNSLDLEIPSIDITHGKYSVVGQPLPNDICIEVDDSENSRTKLEAIFRKNEILPLRRTFTKVVTRTVSRNSAENIVINVLEGSENANPSTLQPIGVITVSGKDLSRDLLKGSDVEITLEISESRDLIITSYLFLTDQEFRDVFSATQRTVSIVRLRSELQALLEMADKARRSLDASEDFEGSAHIMRLREELMDLVVQSEDITEDDVTDTRYQLEDKKRKMAQVLDGFTRDQEISDVKMEYFRTKRITLNAVEESDKEAFKSRYEMLVSGEKDLLKFGSIARIKEVTDQLWELRSEIVWHQPDYLKFLFTYFHSQKDQFSNPKQGEEYIKMGLEGIENNQWSRVQIAINGMYSLLPHEVKSKVSQFGTGIG